MALDIQKTLTFLPVERETYISHMVEFLKVALPNDYQDFLESNRFRVLLDAIGGEQALLALYMNANLLQMFLPTATTRQAMYLLGQLVNYTMSSAQPSSTLVTFSIRAPHAFDIPIPALTQVQAPGNPPIIFETQDEAVIEAGQTSVIVEVLQGETLTEVIGTTSVSSTPNQQFTTTLTPIFDSNSIVIQSLEWTRFNHLFDMTASDKGFIVRPDKDAFAIFTFGDGVFGTIPPVGQAVVATYRVGGGQDTNVPRNTITQIIGSIVDTSSNIVPVFVTNPSGAVGGEDRESVDQARFNIPRFVRSMDRFVSEEDFKSIPSVVHTENGTIFKSSASVKYNWAIHIITVFLLAAPEEGSEVPLLPSQALIDYTKQFVEDRTLPTIRINIEPGILVPVNITGTIFYLPNYRLDIVQGYVNAALEVLFDPVVREMGDGFRLSDMYAILDDATGVDYVDIAAPVDNIAVESNEFIIRGDVNFTFVRQTIRR